MKINTHISQIIYETQYKEVTGFPVFIVFGELDGNKQNMKYFPNQLL